MPYSPKCGLEYAKIIAIVDRKTSKVNNYDWSVARDHDDFFADPEDRKKYLAITVKNLRCDSIAELKAKFEVALEYLTADFLGTIEDVVKGAYKRKGIRDINKKGLIDYTQEPLVWRRIRAAPLAHGVWFEGYPLVVNSNYNQAMLESKYDGHHWIVVRKRYKLDDHVMLMVEGQPEPRWFSIESCHGDEYIGRRIGGCNPDEMCQFSSKHVFDHRSDEAMMEARLNGLTSLFHQ